MTEYPEGWLAFNPSQVQNPVAWLGRIDFQLSTVVQTQKQIGEIMSELADKINAVKQMWEEDRISDQERDERVAALEAELAGLRGQNETLQQERDAAVNDDDADNAEIQRLTDAIATKQTEIDEASKVLDELLASRAPEQPAEDTPEAPVVDEPVVDEPVVDEPVVDEPVVDEPVVDEPVVDEPVVDEPVNAEPTPAMGESITGEPVPLNETNVENSRPVDGSGFPFNA